MENIIVPDYVYLPVEKLGLYGLALRSQWWEGASTNQMLEAWRLERESINLQDHLNTI